MRDQRTFQSFDAVLAEIENKISVFHNRNNNGSTPRYEKRDHNQKLINQRGPEAQNYIPNFGFKRRSRIEEKIKKYREEPIAHAELLRRIEQYQKNNTNEKKKKPPIDFFKLNIMAVAGKENNKRMTNSHLAGPMAKRPVAACRPGIGGWPAVRQESVTEQREHILKRSNHEKEVKKRREAIFFSWYNKEVSMNNQRTSTFKNSKYNLADKPNEILAQDEVGSKDKLADINKDLASVIATDKINEKLEREKRAAVKIASWYKRILVRRNQQAMLDSCMKIKKILGKYINYQREVARKRCAMRALFIMKKLTKSNKIAIAVNQFKNNVLAIQRAWRDLKSVREVQHVLLRKQLFRFKSRLLKSNKSTLKAAAMGLKVKKLAISSKWALSPRDHIENFNAKTKVEKRKRKVKMDDECEQLSQEQIRILGTLTMQLPKDVKDKIVEERLKEEVCRFTHRWEQYLGDKRVYERQKPIDDARIRLLRHAGIEAESQVVKPERPRLRVLQTINGLSTMTERGIQLLIA